MTLALNQRQSRFVAAYIVHGNATQAAVEAGYSERSARNQAARMMRNDDVRAAIDAAQADALATAGVTAAGVRRELAALAFSDIRDVVSWATEVDADGRERTVVKVRDSSVLTREQAASIAEVRSDRAGSVAVRMRDKQRALDALARDLGMGRDGDDVPTEVVIQLKWPEDEGR